MDEVRGTVRSATVVAVLLVAAVAGPRISEAQPLCDPNGDGVIGVTDGVQVLRAAVGLPSDCTLATCDADGDGVITVVDGVNVLRAAVSLASDCDRTDRFVNNGDGTVTDNQTGLQWEKKTDDGGVHDMSNTYTWTNTSDGDYTDPDGTAFTVFLAALNRPPCFAGHCDWRLPKVNRDGDPAELETILLAPYPCVRFPCIDPIFGPTAAFTYWSATTIAVNPALAWYVDFFSGGVGFGNKDFDRYVRAVRAGL
jgi:hypothetical protein